MRRIISVLITLVTFVVSARQISLEEARNAAMVFWGDSISENQITPQRVECAAPANIDLERQPYYVFNAVDDGGFVIISGDDRAKKILGYSDNGSFDFSNIPPQLSWILKEYEKQLSTIPADVLPDVSWQNNETNLTEGILLETANWGQGYPYNAQCPLIDGSHTPTGCVATAMAIVMKYYNWPESARSFSDFVEGGVERHIDFSQYHFDFDQMPMNAGNTAGDVSADMSRLMLAAGRAVNMDYGKEESGAYFEIAAHQLQEKFAYSPLCEYLMSQDYSWDAWINILKGELDNGRPVLYSGSSAMGKHAFVCDGYRGDYIHVNWGWDGNENGYFDLSGIIYSLHPSMVVNIVPDKTGIIYARAYTARDGIYTLFQETDVINVSVPEIKTGVRFDISSPTIHTPYRYDGKLGFALVDKSGNIKEVFAIQNVYGTGEQFFNAYGDGRDFQDYDQQISSEVASDDIIQLVAKESGEDEWRFILGCSAIPTSMPVNNCHSRFATVYLECDPQIEFNHVVWQSGSIGGYERVTVDKFVKLFGTQESCNVKVINGADGYGLVTVVGKAAYGNVYTNMCAADFDADFGFKLVDDEYHITAKFYEYAEPMSIKVDSPGTLSELIDLEQARKMYDLTLSGNVNAFDIWYIRENMKGLHKLDMESVKICGVESKGVFINNFEVGEYQNDDTMPEWGLNGMQILEEVVLPSGLRYLSDMSLSELNIRKIVLPASIDGFGVNNFFLCSHLAIVENLNPNPVDIQECNLSSTLCPYEGALIVPVSSIEAYRKSPVWQDFKNFYPLGTILPERLEVKDDFISLGVGHSMKMPEVTYYPDNVTVRELEIYYYNENIVSISDDGYITGISAGSTVARVKSVFGGDFQWLHIFVYEQPVEFIDIYPEQINGVAGSEIQLSLTVRPENATNRAIVWSSDNEDVADVDSNGLVRLLAKGNAIITASAADGHGACASCSVIVDDMTGIENVLTGMDAVVKIYNTSGVLIFDGKCNECNLKDGIYIVVVDGERYKCLIR